MGFPAKRAPLDQIRVRVKRVDISLPSICQYLYGKDVNATTTPLTAEFEYRSKLVKYGRFLREPELRVTTKRWLSRYLSVDVEVTDWVLDPKEDIKKANLTFTVSVVGSPPLPLPHYR